MGIDVEGETEANEDEGATHGLILLSLRDCRVLRILFSSGKTATRRS